MKKLIEETIKALELEKRELEKQENEKNSINWIIFLI